MKLFGSSGIRAVYDKNLLDIAFKTGLAVGKSRKNVIVGRDTRTSGDAMKHAVIAGLLAAGADCRDAGITPTPTLAYVARDFDAAIMITASHNPPEYNGLKLINPDGSSFGSGQQTEIEGLILNESFEVAGWENVKPSGVYDSAIEKHINAIAADFPTDLNVKVVVDAGCGAAAEVTPLLLDKLGCKVTALSCYPSGFFPRGIEPLEANLAELCRLVKESGAALGIAHDGDADRMMAVDGRGRYIGGDKMLAIIINALGAKDVVTTLDASMAIDELGIKIRRTRIGDTFVSEELRKGGDFGGETAGAWIFPRISLCPDGIYAAALVAALAGKQSLAELADAVPAYPLVRGSVNSKGISLARLEQNLMALGPLKVSKIDGLKLDFENGWLLVRPSGTEPKIRLTAEAKTTTAAGQLYERGREAVKNAMDIGVRTS